MTGTIERQPVAPKDAQRDVLIPVRDLIDKHPDLALTIRETVTQYVRDAEYPALVPVQITDDGETYAGVRCPWCGIDVENSEHLDVLDENDRSTTISADEFDHDHRTVSPDDDDRGQFDGLCDVCTGCDRPVSLPTTWTER